MNYKNIKFFNQRSLKTLFFWIAFWFIQSILMSGGQHIGFYLIKNVAIVSLQFLVVLVNLFLLFPYLFQKRRYLFYAICSFTLVYLVFSTSFFFINLTLSTAYTMQSNFGAIKFSTDFWRILSGSSFYSLALVCSTLYQLLQIHRQVEKENQAIKQSREGERLCIKEGNKSHFVNISSILFIKGLREYVSWNTEEQKIISLESLKDIEKRLGPLGFIRVHKSYIVNAEKITFVSGSNVRIGNIEIPIGRKYRENTADLHVAEGNIKLKE